MFLLATLDQMEQRRSAGTGNRPYFWGRGGEIFYATVYEFFKETLDFASFLFYLLINLASGEWMLRLLIQAIILAGQALV